MKPFVKREYIFRAIAIVHEAVPITEEIGIFVISDLVLVVLRVLLKWLQFVTQLSVQFIFGQSVNEVISSVLLYLGEDDGLAGAEDINCHTEVELLFLL